MVEYILQNYLTISLNNMRFLNITVILALSIVLLSCFEDDTHVDPLPINEVNILNSIYEYQIYVDIENSSIVSSNRYSEWDLGFESSPGGYHIILNTARFMYAGNTFETNFDAVNSATPADMYFDNSNGDLDSTVLKDWVDMSDPDNLTFTNYVYVIDRGRDEEGNSFGFKKLFIEKLEQDTFYIRFANLDGTEDYRFSVPKDTSVNFNLFSFENGGQFLVSEPNKNRWDFCLTKYTTIIPDDDGTLYDYIVRGALLNPHKGIEVGVDKENYFYDITFNMIDSYTYSLERDAIGYEWKNFDQEQEIYIIEENYSYILKNVNGLTYKLRFTDFFKDGEKGYPSFEIMELTNTI